MSKTPNYDLKIKTILDVLRPGERICDLTGEKWNMDEEEIGWYKKFNVPPSKYSPKIRLSILSSFTVAYQFWWHKHAITNAPLLSVVHPATKLKVITDEEYAVSDFSTINKDYDKTINFLRQFRELQLQIPLAPTRNYIKPENSLVFSSYGDQNSYFVGASRSKESFFGSASFDIENSAEFFVSSKVTSSFNIVHSQRIHNCRYVRECFDCLNSSFLFDCRNCEFCFGAINQRNKKYVFFNQQLTQEAYEIEIAKIDLSSREIIEQINKRFAELALSQGIWPENFNEGCQNCLGEYLRDCKDNRFCYQMVQSNNNYYSAFSSLPTENSAFTGGSGLQNCYSCCPCGKSNDCKFVGWGSQCHACEYCLNCEDCEYCFGCVGLKRKNFCILNRQYTEEEYWSLVDSIKCQMLQTGEYGEYFPASFSQSYFPESGAAFFCLANNEIGEKIKANIFDPTQDGAIGQQLSSATKVKQPNEIPDKIGDLKAEDWVGVAIDDPVFKRRFAFLKPEIDFYKQEGIAPPTTHFISRVRKLFLSANSWSFETSECSKCQKNIFVAKNKTYSTRKIYCQACYLKYLEENN